MSTIIPDTDLMLLEGVPLTSDFKNTYWFPTLSAQYNFFKSKAYSTYTDFTPVKLEQAVRVAENANNIYQCSYLMFQNSNFGTKWFYAFITSIDYVNPSVSIVHYEIDNLQSWWFDFRFQRSFVEREHVSDDTIGANLVPENLEMGDYIINDTESTGYFLNYNYVVFATVEEDGYQAVGGLYSGIYNGLTANVFTTPDAVNNFLTSITTQNKSSAVVSIVMIPSAFIAEKGTEAEYKTYSISKNLETLDGYTPKNNKLFTAPFNLLVCTNMAGSSGNFRYEYFLDDDLCSFMVYMDMSANPTAMLVPLGYNTVSASEENWNEKVGMDGFPQCGWNIDTFKAWVAQNGASTAISTMGTALGAAGSLFTGNLMGAAQAGLSIAGTVAQVKATEALPPQAHGPSSSNALVALNKKDFWFYKMSVRKEFAQIIDNFFDLYGYAVHRVKLINFHSRPSWNYIKTMNANIVGEAPQYAISKMRSILDNGITFWHGDWLGDYSRNNQLEETHGET